MQISNGRLLEIFIFLSFYHLLSGQILEDGSGDSGVDNWFEDWGSSDEYEDYDNEYNYDYYDDITSSGETDDIYQQRESVESYEYIDEGSHEYDEQLESSGEEEFDGKEIETTDLLETLETSYDTTQQSDEQEFITKPYPQIETSHVQEKTEGSLSWAKRMQTLATPWVFIFIAGGLVLLVAFMWWYLGSVKINEICKVCTEGRYKYERLTQNDQDIPKCHNAKSDKKNVD